MAEALGFIALNAALLCLGAGLLPHLRIPRSVWILDLALAYVVGYASAGLASSCLVLVRVSIGWIALGLAAAAIIFGLQGLTRSRLLAVRAGIRPPADVALALGVLLAAAVPAFATRPLVDWDAWAIWEAKARALVAFRGADPSILSHTPHADYPLLIPGMEAVHFRVLGGFDPLAMRLLHVQFLLLGIAFSGAVAALLLRAGIERSLAWRGVAVVVSNPMFAFQLLTALADAPLAIFVSLGALGMIPQPAAGVPALRRFSVLMLTAAVVTKDEGTLFAAALTLAVVFSAPSGSRLRSLLAFGTVPFIAALLWRVYCVANGLGTGDYQLQNALRPHYLLDHVARVLPALQGLAASALIPTWPLVVLLLAIGIALARRRGDHAQVTFIVTAAVLPLACLVLIYWISTPDVAWLVDSSAQRVTLPLGTMLAVLVPALVAERGVRPHGWAQWTARRGG